MRAAVYALVVAVGDDNRAVEPYGFRRAHQAGAFTQARLMDVGAFGRAAKDRGILTWIGSTLREGLEELDRLGVLRPVLFDLDDDGHVFRDEVGFEPWETYEVRGPHGYVAVHACYSEWQLLYLKDAIETGQARVPIEWVLDEGRKVSPLWREWFEGQDARRRAMDDAWRQRLLLLIRLQDRYIPTVRGTLTKTTTSLVYDPRVGERVDPYPDTVRRFRPKDVLDELRLNPEEVKAIYDQVALHGIMRDPLKSFHDLFRMAPYRERAKLKRGARCAQDAFDAAEMIRRFYHDLTGELLPRPDAMTDASDGSWRTRLYGHEPRLVYDRHDLQVALRIAHLDPHIVHIVVEGKSDEILFHDLIEALAGRPPDAMGITFSNLDGVGRARLHGRILRIAKTLARFPILVADREGDIERDVEILKRDGLLTDETTFLWNASLEEDNFTDEELVAVAARLAMEQGATLTLTGRELREAADRPNGRGEQDSTGLAESLRKLAASPEHGSVLIPKPDLARGLVGFLVEELQNADDTDDVFERRPVLNVVASIIRVA